MTPACIFHICTRAAAEAARASGSYRTASLDTEGFIHMSQAHQVHTVLDAFYAGQPDLVLLLVVPQLLRSPLRFEAPSTLPHAPGALLPDASQLFPHLYGALNMDAVVDVLDVAQFQGAPVHPDTAALLQHYRFERLPVEGTLYRSTWRSGSVDDPRPPAGTAMIGLYADSPRSVSCFHRLTRDEVWHVYGGDAFTLYLLHPDGRSEEVLMGPDPLAGQRVQQLIPAGVWQAGCLVPGGRHALFGCTMAPGFTGGCFEAAQPEVLIALYPQQAATIRRLAVIGAALAMPAGFAP
jgi:uncharacterized protein (DUF952 family)/predicted cupin superfamily sugar epimerase